MTPPRPLLGAALLLAAAVLWGLAFVPQKITVGALLPLQATLLRFAIAAPLALLVARGRLRKLAGKKRREDITVRYWLRSA